MIEHESSVDVIDVLQHLEEVDVLVKTDALHNKKYDINYNNNNNKLIISSPPP